MKRKLLTLLALSMLAVITVAQSYSYRYWIDGNAATSSSASGQKTFEVDISSLANGVHALHVQALKGGTWSSARTRYFLKATQSAATSARYWFDNNPSTMHNNVATTGSINLDVSQLANGLHAVHYQLLGSNGPSAVRTCYFLKATQSTATSARYWFDNDPSTMHNNVATTGSINLDISQLGVGLHAVHYQTTNANGIPSAVRTRYFLIDHVQKSSLTASISIDDGEATDYALSDENIVIDITELTDGEHTLHVTLLDGQGNIVGVQEKTFSTFNGPVLSLESLTIEGNKLTGESHTVVGVITNTGSDFSGSVCLYYRYGNEGEAVRNNTINTEIQSGATETLSYDFEPAISGTYYLWLATYQDPDEIIGNSITVEIEDNLSGQTLAYTTIPAMTYGDEDYTLPQTTAEGLTLSWSVDNDVVASISGNTLTIIGAGTATVTATQAGNDSYQAFSREFSLTVDKAALTITANNCTKQEGDDNPELTVSYSGFKNNDDATSLTTQPAVTTTATKDSPAGTYPITASGAASDNYEFTYVNGTLTVTEQPATIEVTDISQMDNVIYIEPTEEKPGTEVTISFKMKNTVAIRGFQFDLELPEGVTPVEEDDEYVYWLNADRAPKKAGGQYYHTLEVTKQSDGTYRFLCGAQADKTFKGNDGEVAVIQVAIANDMNEGDYPIVLRNIKLTETDISNYYQTAEVVAKLTIVNYIPGDISGDGIVDVSDYIGVANHILGNTPAGFNACAADVNNDNVIDVSDYIGIANIILTGSIYGNNNAARLMDKEGEQDPQ